MFSEHKAPTVVLHYNVNPFIDHQNGEWVIGSRGEAILVGGLGPNTGVAAMQNCGKTALLLELYSKVSMRYPSTTGYLQDVEGTLPQTRVVNAMVKAAIEDELDFSAQEQFEANHTHIGPSLYLDEWYDTCNKEMTQRRLQWQKAKDKDLVTMPMDINPIHKDKTIPLMLLGMDSLSEATGKDIEAKLEKEGVVDSKNQTMDMLNGNLKTRVMNGTKAWQPLCNALFLSTASIDTFVDVGGGPPGRGPAKTMAHLAADKKLKGTGSKYKKLTSALWTFGHPKPLYKGTGSADKMPKYPRDKDDYRLNNPDLEYVEILNQRGKSGPSGMAFTLIRSQSEGVLNHITNLNFCRVWGKDTGLSEYGVHGAGQHTFALDLYPDVKWRNTTVREKLDQDYKMRRALEITLGLKMDFFAQRKPMAAKYQCTPAELYTALKDMGYDWDVLLDTRGWWCHKEDEGKFKPYLSMLDLLRMKAGEYVPYWFTKEQTAAIKKAA